MDDLIDRQKLLKKKQYSFQTEYGTFSRHDYFIKLSDIRSMPAIDTERHAHWILEKQPDGTPYCYHCSRCDSDFSRLGIKTAYDYCQYCGCKMDEVKE
jgi:hypothetical protein